MAGTELQALIAAVDTGSVHAAADALDLTQSAVTKRLQRLEQRLGVRLLTRSREGVQPTEAGRSLYPAARAAMQALQQVEAVALESRRELAVEFAIAATPLIADYLLPGWLERFAVEHPATHAHVEPRGAAGVLEALRRHEAELGLLEGPAAMDDMERLLIARDELVVVIDGSTGDRPSRELWACHLRGSPPEGAARQFWRWLDAHGARTLA